MSPKALFPEEDLFPEEELYPETGGELLRVIEKPPMRQYLIATTPGGHVRRWGEDEPDAADVLEELTDSDTAPGGNKDLTAALARKPGTDYSDMQLGTKLEVFGAGQYKVSEYRLERNPRTSGDTLVVDPAASGYQVLLSDKEEAREIFVDAELGAWSDVSTARLLELEFMTKVNVMVGTQGIGNEPASIIFAYERLTEGWMGNEYSYFGAGIDIGRVLFGFVGTGFDEAWSDFAGIRAGDTGTSALIAQTGDFNSVSEPSWDVPEGGAIAPEGGKYAFFQVARDQGASSLERYVAYPRWQTPRVLGRHGLPLYGASRAEIGVLASDVIGYALSRWAPGIRFTTGPFGSIKASRFVIPHLVFKEPTTVQEMVTQSLRFETLEWGVWSGQFGPTFYLNERGRREGAKRWRTRIRPAKFSETGQQMDQIYNRVVMSWQNDDGTMGTMGPIGSGYPLTDSRCEDVDPENALNEAGVVRTKHLTMNGVATVEGAAETSRLFLEKCRLLDGSGEATLTGFVEDEKGAEWPYYCVHAADEIEFIDSSISGPRYIVEATRSRKSRSVNIKIDAPPDSYTAILEELQVRETAAGFGS